VIPTGHIKKKGQVQTDKDTDEVMLVGVEISRPIRHLPPRDPKGTTGHSGR